jgi:hypothetical protein
MIVEGVMTTHNADGTVNVAPMGPIVTGAFESFLFRPYRTSTTYINLKRTGAGVFHVTDDVLLIARSALNLDGPFPATQPAKQVAGAVLSDACRWYEVEVESLDDAQERTEIRARTVHVGRIRDFLGFNRAKHAVLEATILATRLHLLPFAEVQASLKTLAVTVNKTAGPPELEAFQLVEIYIRNWNAAPV